MPDDAVKTYVDTVDELRDVLGEPSEVVKNKDMAQASDAMNKLAEQNLADLNPNPLIEWLLHDHPALAKRIAAVEKL